MSGHQISDSGTPNTFRLSAPVNGLFLVALALCDQNVVLLLTTTEQNFSDNGIWSSTIDTSRSTFLIAVTSRTSVFSSLANVEIHVTWDVFRIQTSLNVFSSQSSGTQKGYGASGTQRVNNTVQDAGLLRSLYGLIIFQSMAVVKVSVALYYKLNRKLRETRKKTPHGETYCRKVTWNFHFTTPKAWASVL